MEHWGLGPLPRERKGGSITLEAVPILRETERCVRIRTHESAPLRTDPLHCRIVDRTSFTGQPGLIGFRADARLRSAYGDEEDGGDVGFREDN